MKLLLYNTLGGKIEEFKPLRPLRVGMYTCGPTVYGPGHLGHARSYVNFDLLKRTFLYNGYKVEHILNITDIHDDMIRRADKLGLTVQELADRYIPLFKEDLAGLNTIPADAYPRVTEHIGEIVEMVKVLVAKGYGYVEKDGSVYYDVSKFKNYGKLSNIKAGELRTGTRVETDKYERDDAADFALWKGWKKGEPFWPSPWGRGRPGWHIECSALANKYLGKTIDLHAGAMDLKFPHHENEIAQSEAANGVKLANFWFHGGLLEVEGQKMSKSLGNYIEMGEIKKRGFDPLALRCLFLTAHYRTRMNFTWKALAAAQRALNRLRSAVSEWEEPKIGCAEYEEKFLRAVNHDLDLPRAWSLVWKLVKSDYPSAAKKATLLKFDRILGLGLAGKKGGRLKEFRGRVSGAVIFAPPSVDSAVVAKADWRERARKERDFGEADRLRNEIRKLGYKIKDTSRGPRLEPVR